MNPVEPTSFDRWPLIVQLSDKVEVEWFRHVPALGWWRDEREVEISGSGTPAVAHVVPRGQAEEAFLTVSMYARWDAGTPEHNPGDHRVATLTSRCTASSPISKASWTTSTLPITGCSRPAT